MNKNARKRLYRSRDDNVLFGVCGGVADYFDWDSTWVRLGAIIMTLLGVGSLILIYLIAAIIIPLQPKN